MAELFEQAPEPKTELGRYRVMSSTAGIRVSPLQLGGMSIGENWNDMMGGMTKEQAFTLLDAYYDAGGNYIDTANNYQHEQSEEWIGDWMQARGNRDHMVIATKFTLPYKAYSQGKAHAINFSGNHKRSMHMSLRDSLKKLQTDWIDVFYLHVWDHTTSIEEIMDSLDALVKSGKVSYLGISDTPAWVVAAANTYARDHGKTQFSIYQGRWNVMLRDMEREILPMAQAFGMAVAVWDVLGQGRLQSKKSVEQRKKNNEGRRGIFNEKPQTEQEVKVSEALSNVAAELGIESVTAVALAYVISKAPNVYPIIGGRKVEYLHDNIQALKLKLTDKQIEYLESITPLDVGFPGNIIGQSPFDTGKGPNALGSAGPLAFSLRAKSILRQ